MYFRLTNARAISRPKAGASVCLRVADDAGALQRLCLQYIYSKGVVGRAAAAAAAATPGRFTLSRETTYAAATRL